MKQLVAVFILVAVWATSGLGWTELEQSAQLYGDTPPINYGASLGDCFYGLSEDLLIVTKKADSDSLPAPVYEVHRTVVKTYELFQTELVQKPKDVAIVGDSLLFVLGYNAIQLYRLADPEHPQYAGEISDQGYFIWGMTIHQGVAYFSRTVEGYAGGMVPNYYRGAAPGMLKLGTCQQMQAWKVTTLYETEYGGGCVEYIDGTMGSPPTIDGSLMYVCYSFLHSELSWDPKQTYVRVYDVWFPDQPRFLYEVRLPWEYQEWEEPTTISLIVTDSIGYFFHVDKIVVTDFRGASDSLFTPLDTLPYNPTNNMVKSDGWLYLPTKEGTILLDISEPATPKKVLTLLEGKTCQKVIPSKGKLTIATLDGFSHFDNRNPLEPVEIVRGKIYYPNLINFTAIDSMVYIHSSRNLMVVNVADIRNPAEVWRTPYTLTRSSDALIPLNDGFVLICDRFFAFYSTADNPAVPVLTDTLRLRSNVSQYTHLSRRGDYLYASAKWLDVYEKNGDEPLRLLYTDSTACSDHFLAGDRLYGLSLFPTAKVASVRMWDISDPSTPLLLPDSLEAPYPCRLLGETGFLYLVQTDRVRTYMHDEHGKPVLQTVCVEREADGRTKFPSSISIHNGFLTQIYYDTLEVYHVWWGDSTTRYGTTLPPYSKTISTASGVVSIAYNYGLKTYKYPAVEWVQGDYLSYPVTHQLLSLYPNPFNSTTRIAYDLPIGGNMSLTVYDLSGREVARLVDSVQPAGRHSVVWKAGDVPAGVYLVKMTGGTGVTVVKKVVLVK